MIHASVKHRIPFHDVDSMKVVWHGYYFKYFEMARSALKKKLGIDVNEISELGYLMPVVSFDVRYSQTLIYDQEILIHAMIDDLFYPSVIVRYKISSLDEKTVFAEASSKQVYIEAHTKELCLSLPENVERVMRESISK